MKIKAYLQKHTRQMQRCFIIEHYEVFVEFASKKVLDGALMDIEVDDDYLRATIQYGSEIRNLYKQGNYEEVLKTLAHELTHVLISEMADKGEPEKENKLEERVTEHVSRLLYRLYVSEYDPFS